MGVVGRPQAQESAGPASLGNGHNDPLKVLRALGWAYIGHFVKGAALILSAVGATPRGLLFCSSYKDALSEPREAQVHPKIALTVPVVASRRV